MAKDQPVRFTARFIDYKGIRAAATAYVLADGTKTLANLKTDLEAWGTLLAGVSTAKITDLTLSYAPAGDPVGLTPTGWTDSDVLNTAVLDFYVPSNGRIWGFAVPSYADTLVSGGKIVADSGAVADLGGGMGSSTNEDYVNNQGLALGALQSAFPTGRKHRGIRTKGRGLSGL